MKKPIPFLFLLFLLAGAFPAVAAPRRVVSLSPALTELVFQLGAGEQLVGRSEACDFPAAAKALPVAGKFAQPDCEKILRLRPTLVIANDFVNPAHAERLRACGIAVELRQCRNPGDYRQWVERLGLLLDCPEAAEAELARVRKSAAELSARPPLGVSALWVIWDRPLMVAAAGSLPDTVLQLTGAVNHAGKLSPEYCRIAPETLLRNPPDWVIWGLPGKIPATGFWAALRPVREGRVLYLSGSAAERPGPRWFAGIAALRAQWEEAIANAEKP